MFPRFRIRANASGEAVGAVTSTTFGKETWVGEGFLGYLMSTECLIYGRWHRRGDSWGFVPDQKDIVGTLSPDSEWQVIDCYWGERTALVLDSKRIWIKTGYKGQDHDHCAICWESIGAGGEGYVDDGATWVCDQCYDSYVKTKSLGFIPIHALPDN
jgi:hypothetical protein